MGFWNAPVVVGVAAAAAVSLTASTSAQRVGTMRWPDRWQPPHVLHLH